MEQINATLSALTAGLRELPTDDLARVRHFLAEYLGDQAHPVPFGGRTKDFARLDNWLDTRDSFPYALLAAPAGRGKSALLLRWCEQLLQRPDVAVVYFPVSIRFRTNLARVIFPALIALLARLHGETLPSELHTHEEIWHGLLMEYLTRPLADGRQLLLILDGIDEAADWEAGEWLFPATPPAGLRIMLSARYLASDLDASAWLARLGWARPGLAQAFELYPLDRTGIASVLVQMGFPLDRLGTRVDIVAELHRLSEGDPLLLRLYVDDLWQRGYSATRLRAEDLQTIHPGLTGYFERWWNEQRSLWDREAPQRESAVQTVLSLLAGALGPLSKEDLLHLAPEHFTLSNGTVEQHLEPLERFVIGDGMQQGYVFSHPRLANYFLEERLREAERAEIEQRFLDWGARTLDQLNAETLTPEQASPYIVHYYGAHLERAQADADAFFALVSDGWRRAWERLDRSNAGFLGDSERAWRAAERANHAEIDAGRMPSRLDREVRSLLCRVSITSMTSNIPPHLMLEAVKTGIWTPAQGLASLRLIPDPLPRARELVGLAPALQEPLRAEVLQEALDTLNTLKYERDRLDALVELAPGFPSEMLEQVLASVHALEDEADRAGMLAELAPALAISPALLAKALAIAQEIDEEEYLVLALEGLIPFLARAEVPPILDRASELEDERYRAQLFTALLPFLSETQLAEMLAESQHLLVSISQMRLLAALAGRLPEEARDEILQIILEQLNEFINQEERVDILLKLAPYLPMERLRQMLAELQSLWDESYRAQALCTLWPLLPEELWPAFLENTLALQREEQRIIVLRQVLPDLPGELRALVLKHVPLIWDEGLRVEILALLAPNLKRDLRAPFLEQIDALEDPGYGIWLLAEMESSLTHRQADTGLADAFLAIEQTEERIQTLLAIIERVSDEALRSIFALLEPEIFGFRLSLRHTERVADMFAKLAARMPEAWLDRVLTIAKTLENEAAQTQVLLALAPRIDERRLPATLDIVRDMYSRERRSQVLEALVALLPQERKGERVREMLQVLQIIKDVQERAVLFETYIAPLATPLPENRLREILFAVTALRSELYQAQILASLAPRLHADQVEAVLYALPMLESDVLRERVLKALAPYLPESLVSNYLTVTRTLKDERQYVAVLTTFAESVTPATFQKLLRLAQNIQDHGEQAKLLGVLAARLPEEAFPQFWAILKRHLNAGQRVWLLNILAAYVPPKYFLLFWDTLQEIEDLGWRTRALATLAAQTSESQYAQLWDVVQQITERDWYFLAITTLAASVPVSFFPQLFQAAQALLAESVPDTIKRFVKSPASALEILVERVPADFFLRFWQTVSEIDDQWSRANIFLRLIERVPEVHFAEVWNSVSSLDTGTLRQEQFYTSLIKRIPEPLFALAWEKVQEMTDSWHRDKWLLILSTRVPENYIQQFWQEARNMQNSRTKTAVLLNLAPRLAQGPLAEIIDLALRFSAPDGGVVNTLKRLLPLLSTEQVEAFLARILPETWSEDELPQIFARLQSKYTWWKPLATVLIPLLTEESLRVFLPPLVQVMYKQLPADEDRVKLLGELFRHVPVDALPLVLETIWSIQIENGQEQLLCALLTSPHFTAPAWRQALELATAQARSTGQAHYLLHLLHNAPLELQQTDVQSLYHALNTLLHMLAQYSRRETEIGLVALATTLHAFANDAMHIAIAGSALEIGNWWP